MRGQVALLWHCTRCALPAVPAPQLCGGCQLCMCMPRVPGCCWRILHAGPPLPTHLFGVVLALCRTHLSCAFAGALPLQYRSPAAPVSLPQVGGANFKADALSRVANESGHKLETEVLAPLTRWQDVHLQLVVSSAAV